MNKLTRRSDNELAVDFKSEASLNSSLRNGKKFNSKLILGCAVPSEGTSYLNLAYSSDFLLL